jgi:hypothetical protein
MIAGSREAIRGGQYREALLSTAKVTVAIF